MMLQLLKGAGLTPLRNKQGRLNPFAEEARALENEAPLSPKALFTGVPATTKFPVTGLVFRPSRTTWVPGVVLGRTQFATAFRVLIEGRIELVAGALIDISTPLPTRLEDLF